ncbi:MAG: PPOX class F420-dependent oxidoreductase [Anaerolineae bacterium]|nr:PPOX class F420-dependent oxidoreductase [Anaerolineae bacterium]
MTIPQSHMDLLTNPIHAVFSTLMPDGRPQSSIVWADTDRELVLINTTLERQKGKNIQANPKVNVLVIDPTNISRWLEIRGEVVEITTEGAIPHADKLARQYSGGKKQFFYGDVYPPEQRDRETRVIVKIRPVKVTRDGIFA